MPRYYRNKRKGTAKVQIDFGEYSDWSADKISRKISELSSQLAPIKTLRERLNSTQEITKELSAEKEEITRRLMEKDAAFVAYQKTNLNWLTKVGSFIGNCVFLAPFFYWFYADFDSFIVLIWPIIFIFGALVGRLNELLVKFFGLLLGSLGQSGEPYLVVRERILASPPKPLRGVIRKLAELENEMDGLRIQVNREVDNEAKIKSQLKALRAAKKQATKKERSARLAAYDGKARQGSQSLKKQLLKNIKTKAKDCPYCGHRTPKAELVLDHIHPIAKGGQTVLQNSILICQPCNSSKRALTLRAFSKKAGHDHETVAARLERQGKWV